MARKSYGSVNKLNALSVSRKRIDKSSPRFSLYRNVTIPPLEFVSSRPLSYRAGCYNPDGTLIESSVSYRMIKGKMEPITRPVERASQTSFHHEVALFAGTLYPHFGHFLLESTARLWAARYTEATIPIIFQSISPAIARYARAFFDAIGLGERIKIVPPSGSLSVDSLIIPSPTFVEGGYAHREFLLPFASATARDDKSVSRKKIYIDRGKNTLAPIFGETALKLALLSSGYTILDPTQSAIEDVAFELSNAQIVVGLVGSHMHNLVFCRSDCQIGYILRGPVIHPNYLIVDDVLEVEESSIFFVGEDIMPAHSELRGPYLINAPKAVEFLKEAGFVDHSADAPSPEVFEKDRHAYLDQWDLNRRA